MGGPLFSTDYLHTTGAGFYKIVTEFENYDFKAQVWVINTKEHFTKTRLICYRGSLACLVIFEKDDQEVFARIPKRIQEFKKHSQVPGRRPIAIVGIITESEAIIREEGENLARQHGCDYFETSLQD